MPVLLCTLAIDCDVLDGIDNGYVTYTGGTLLNSMAEYFCNTGYQLPPWVSTRTCLATGFWSGVEPSCNSELLPYVHTYVCTYVHHIVRGTIAQC